MMPKQLLFLYNRCLSDLKQNCRFCVLKTVSKAEQKQFRKICVTEKTICAGTETTGHKSKFQKINAHITF